MRGFTRHNALAEAFCGEWRAAVLEHFAEAGESPARLAAADRFLARWLSPRS